MYENTKFERVHTMHVVDALSTRCVTMFDGFKETRLGDLRLAGQSLLGQKVAIVSEIGTVETSEYSPAMVERMLTTQSHIGATITVVDITANTYRCRLLAVCCGDNEWLWFPEPVLMQEYIVGEEE